MSARPLPLALPFLVGCAAALTLGNSVTLKAKETNDLAKRATWSQPTREQVTEQLQQWLAKKGGDQTAQQKAIALLEEKQADVPFDMLDQVVAAIALFEADAKQLLIACHADPSSPTAPSFPLLNDSAADPWAKNNLKLYFGRWLAQHDLYDEAHEYLGGMAVADVVDPASLLFYRAVCAHQLLHKEAFEASIQQLLENKAQLPKRYVTVAQLMEADFGSVETDSLDEIQRMMSDIRRRLNLGRAGTRVRTEEDDVIAKLDKLIQKAEEQQKKQQGGAGSGSASPGQPPNNPAQDSRAPAGGGPGDVEAKKIGHKSGWGNLPPKERQEALQQIGKELPAHYREVIEEYFRKLAQDGT